MPSITTHHMFAKEVFDSLEDKNKSKIIDELDIFYTFAQSHDYLFYYTFDLKNKKRINDLGHTAHHHKTQDYLLNIIKEIKNNHLENNQQAVAYLYGSITHYCLDTTCHPYIFYKTGVYRRHNKKYYKYRGEHNRIEKDLDAIYYEKYTGKKYNKCNLNKEIVKKPIFTQELIKIISNVYEKTYNEKNIGKIYYKSISDTRIINTIIINDYLGIKKLLYRLLDFITNKHFGYISGYSTYIRKPNYNYLNNTHKIWNHPCIKEKKYNYSFNDLFDISLKKCLVIIKEVNKVLYETKDISTIINVIPDLDYSTGLPIDDSIRMDYFEY